MLNRRKTKKTGLDVILEVAGATMGDLGANLAKTRTHQTCRRYPLYQMVKRERRSIEQSLSRKQEVIISRPRAQQLAHLQVKMLPPPTKTAPSSQPSPTSSQAIPRKQPNKNLTGSQTMAQTTKQPSRRKHLRITLGSRCLAWSKKDPLSYNSYTPPVDTWISAHHPRWWENRSLYGRQDGIWTATPFPPPRNQHVELD